MQGDCVVNITLLREQADAFFTEKAIANNLSVLLSKAQKEAMPEKSQIYKHLIQQSNELEDFYLDMSKASSSIADDIEHVLSEIQVQLEDNMISNTKKFNLND